MGISLLVTCTKGGLLALVGVEKRKTCGILLITLNIKML
jgi:hypothetical protein